MSQNVVSAGLDRSVPSHVPEGLVYDYDFVFDADLNKDPHRRMSELHGVAPPLFYSPRYGGHWVVLSREYHKEITLNYQDFTSANLMLPPAESVPVLIPATFDPPEHTAYRLPVNKLFSAPSVQVREPSIRALAVKLIDAVARQGRCDFLFDVVEPFPPSIIFEIVGIPLDNLREFRQLAQTFMSSPSAEERVGAYRRIGEILTPVVKARMAEPRDDLLSVLARADFGGRQLTMEQILNYAVLLFIGGLDTVVNALCFTARHLARDMALQNDLRAHPEKIPEAMEEFLRLYPVATPMRTATRDLEFHGIRIRKGDQFLCLLGSINTDPNHYDQPTGFCPHRREHHVAFNTGHHRCLGANLGRLELRVFFEEWLKRIPEFRLDPDHPPRFSAGYSISVESLPLVWEPA